MNRKVEPMPCLLSLFFRIGFQLVEDDGEAIFGNTRAVIADPAFDSRQRLCQRARFSFQSDWFILAAMIRCPGARSARQGETESPVRLASGSVKSGAAPAAVSLMYHLYATVR